MEAAKHLDFLRSHQVVFQSHLLCKFVRVTSFTNTLNLICSSIAVSKGEVERGTEGEGRGEMKEQERAAGRIKKERGVGKELTNLFPGSLLLWPW